MITWSSYQFRPRVTHRVRYSVSTTALLTTSRSKEPSTVSLLVPPTEMITKESWLLGYNWLAHNLRVSRLEKSSSLGSSRCLPDVFPDLINSIKMGFVSLYLRYWVKWLVEAVLSFDHYYIKTTIQTIQNGCLNLLFRISVLLLCVITITKLY